MDFGFGKFSLVDSSDVTKGANVTTTGLYNSLSVVVRDSQGTIIDNFGSTGSGGATITNYALETGGNLATIAGKDFATQTTLALIKAKTDNIDVLLSTRTKPADQQHIIIDSGNPTSITANAGTNLNTSALATETTLGTVHGHVDSMDTKTPSLGIAAAASSTPVVTAPPTMTTVEFGTLSVGTAGTYVIGTIPGSAYELTVCNASDTDMYWSWKTATSATNGIFLAKTSGTVSFICPASKSPYFYCASTKDLNWTTRTL